MQPGDTVLGLDLAHGGHLTHGMKLNISGMLYHFVSYGVTRDTHRIDFDQVAALAREHKPKLIVAGASAYPREIPHGKFAEIARDVRREAVGRHGPLRRPGRRRAARQPGAGGRLRDHDHAQDAPRPARRLVLCKAEYAKDIDRRVFPGIQGGPLMHVIAGKAVCFGEALRPEFKQLRPGRSSTTPRRWPRRCWPAALRLVSGGTDNHLMLVDVTPLGIGGKLAEAALDRCGITVNKNMIPFDERKPMDPSGIRIGTPALTTRGMGTGRDAADRRLDSRGAQVAGRRSGARPHSRRSVRACASSSPCRRPRWPKSTLTKSE